MPQEDDLGYFLPPDFILLAEARDWVEKYRQFPTKCYCPCCGMRNKIYKRKLNAGEAASLIIFLRHLRRFSKEVARTREIQSPQFHRSREFAKLRYWELIREVERYVWAITEKGVDFVNNDLAVPRHCYVFDEKLLEYGDDGDTTMSQALHDTFDYDELMRGYYDKPGPPPIPPPPTAGKHKGDWDQLELDGDTNSPPGETPQD